MSIYDLTPVPRSSTMRPQGNTGLFPSPLIASATTLDRGGQKWHAVYNYPNISGPKRALLMGLIARLRGQAHRLRVPIYDNPRQGAYGGTPLVNGASQTGSAIAIDGLSNNITDWIKAGDYFSVEVNGEHELKMCTVDANSNGSGQIAVLNFEPRLRASPLNNAVIFVQDGILSRPQGIFVLSSGNAGWTSSPFQSTTEISQIVLAMTEDVFATQ